MVRVGLLGPVHEFGGMTFREGKVWAGLHSLWLSADSGSTWTKNGLTVDPGDSIHDIDFFDANSGLVTTAKALYVTYDGGMSWRKSLSGQMYGAHFVGSANAVILNQNTPTRIWYSVDGARSFRISGTDADVIPLSASGGATVSYVLGGSVPKGAHLYASTDGGATWKKGVARVDFDCWSMVVDPCDARKVYLVNEDGFQSQDGYSQIYVTTDAGDSWQTSASYQIKFFSGSVALTPGAIYCPAIANGVLRNKFSAGGTLDPNGWRSIGGPGNPVDTRLIAAINDNILLTFDTLGNLWRTTNSGGDSVRQGLTAIQIGGAPIRMKPFGCGLFDTVLRLAPRVCNPEHVVLIGATIASAKYFRTINIGTLPRALDVSDSLGIEYAPTEAVALTPTYDTAYLKLSWSVGGERFDSLIQVIGQRPNNVGGAVTNLGVLPIKSGKQVVLPISLKLPKSLTDLKLKLKGVQARIGFSSGVLTIDASKLSTVFTPSALLSVVNEFSDSAHFECNLSSASLPLLTDSLYLGSLTLTAPFTMASRSNVQVIRAQIVTDSGGLSICFGAEADRIATVFEDTASASVKVTSEAEPTFQIFPNPLLEGTDLHMKSSGTTSGALCLRVIDVLGREVLRREMLQNGSSDRSLNIGRNELGVGLFLFQVFKTANMQPIAMQRVVVFR
jgi:hypothetical protein